MHLSWAGPARPRDGSREASKGVKVEAAPPASRGRRRRAAAAPSCEWRRERMPRDAPGWQSEALWGAGNGGGGSCCGTGRLGWTVPETKGHFVSRLLINRRCGDPRAPTVTMMCGGGARGQGAQTVLTVSRGGRGDLPLPQCLAGPSAGGQTLPPRCRCSAPTSQAGHYWRCSYAKR